MASITGITSITGSIGIIDSYSESNADGASNLNTAGKNAQAFYVSATQVLYSASFYNDMSGTVDTNVWAEVYAVSGTPGTDAVPTGTVLAVSDAVPSLSISGQSLYTYQFSGANRITLTGGTWYAIANYADSGAVGNCVRNYRDTTSSTHAGNSSLFSSGAWSATGAAFDRIFYVYGLPLKITF